MIIKEIEKCMLALCLAGLIVVVGLYGYGTPTDGTSGFVKTAKEDIHKILSYELGLEIFQFYYEAPVNCKATFWVETYIDGKLSDDLSFSIWRTPKKAEATKGFVRFSRFDPDAIFETKSSRARWQFGFDGMRSGRWIEDPFKKCSGHSGGVVEKRWEVKTGKTYRLLTLRGSKEGRFEYSEDEALSIANNDVVLFIKCRFDLAKKLDFTQRGGASASIPDK